MSEGTVLRRELVRELRQRLAAVVGDEHEVLQPAAAEAGAVEPRLDREHVTGDELVVAGHAEHRLLVHLEADAVAERVEEAAVERLALGLRPQGRIARALEDVADAVEHRLAGHARADRLARVLERLAGETVP